jgi:hypothetical protein
MRTIKKKSPIILLAVFLCVVSCSKTLTTQRMVTPNLDMIPSSLSNDSYQAVKKKWTVTLNAGKSRRPSPMGFGERFPLMVKASLMDAEVIQAGLKHYEKLLSMNPDEADQFRQRYFESHDLKNNVLIEVSLQTSWAEVYLDLSRWTIFIEDDMGNQYEPVKITEHSIPSSDFDERFPENAVNQRTVFPFKVHQKQLLLYFSKLDKYGQPLIHEGVKYLKLVFLQEEGGSSRAEGSWIFDW